MEGIMWKWTNYWSGWQPRWFILDNGVLAYYKSQEEVNQGCKGSIKMSACEIVVHPTDNTRLDLVIPSEQHFYLKAATPQERQQWLVALGSSKACLTANKKKDGVESSPDSLKIKKSELRLYCDLLMQQVHTVKSSATQSLPPDVDKLNEATSLLSATCDTFIKTLEDCMKLANANFTYELPHQHITDSALPTSPSATANSARKMSKTQILRSNSVDSPVMNEAEQSLQPWLADMPIHRRRNLSSSNSSNHSSSRSRTSSESTEFVYQKKDIPETYIPPEVSSLYDSPDFEDEHNNNLNFASDSEFNEKKNIENMAENPITSKPSNGNVDESMPRAMDTFFSLMEISFLGMHKHLLENDEIPTLPFLGACHALTTIFDVLGSPAFIPVKMDLLGNIKKVRQKYDSDPEKFSTLQKIVHQEISTGSTSMRNSATDALLWLKRGLEFVQNFLALFFEGKLDLSSCASEAYCKTLKQYHGLVLRGVFAVAAKAIPYRQEFVVALGPSPEMEDHPLLEKQVVHDGTMYINALDKIVKIIHHFYDEHDLDKQGVV